jgi:hypothetical protein
MSNEAANPTRADTSVVTNNHVVSQVETVHDASSRRFLTRTPARFHHETATPTFWRPRGTVTTFRGRQTTEC